MSKKSDIRRAAEWLKKFDPAEIKEAAEFANEFERQLREKPPATGEEAPYVWTAEQRRDLMELRELWMKLATSFDERARRERNPYEKLLLAGSIAALEGVSETLLELIDDHLVLDRLRPGPRPPVGGLFFIRLQALTSRAFMKPATDLRSLRSSLKSRVSFSLVPSQIAPIVLEHRKRQLPDG